MTLRSHLLRLSLIVVMPLALFGIGTTGWIADRERSSFELGARERTLALLTAIETELSGHAHRLRVLASSSSLQTGDLVAFEREAERVLPNQANWREIILTAPDGKVLVSTANAWQTRPELAASAGLFGEALAAAAGPFGMSYVGNLNDYNGELLFSVHQPVRIANRDAVLTALISPSAILSLLTTQRLSRDWVGVVLDANDNIIARTLDHDSMLGRPASDSLRQALADSNEGWFHGSTIEGYDVYTPYNRSAESGWAVAVGIPAEYVESTMATSLQIVLVGLLAAVLVALWLAALYSKHIAAPIVSLASAARALGSGDEVRSLQQSRFREVRAVSQALVKSGETIREREEKLRTADRAKDEFLAMLGHELRNPLGAIAAASQILSLKTADARAAREAIGVLSRQVERMSRLVDDLLDVGRVVAGKVSLQLAPLDLAEAAEQVIRNLRRSSTFENRNLEVDLSETWIRGDDTRIEQILFNLLENAAKYTRPGGSIKMRVFEDHGTAVVQITDDGVGLSPDLLPRVFDLFSQGKRSIDRGLSGLGIGLTLVKQLTEMHGGSVTAESKGVDLGSRFTLRFPTVEVPDRRNTVSLEGPTPVRPRRILLIEDNHDARRAMVIVLKHLGYRVFEATDGAEGVATAAECLPECAVIDIGLPQHDGYEVAQRIRATPGCEDMLLIALTGYGGADARRLAEAAGFDDHLVKPVAPKDIADLIEARLQQKTADGR